MVINGIHWRYDATITHGGCGNVALDAGNGDTIKAIENYGVV